MKSIGFLVLSCLAAVALSACAGTPSYRGLHLDPPLEVPTIVGIDLQGQPFNSDLLEDRVKVVFFGYTFCPDICPGIMNVIAEAYADLPRQQDQIEIVFLTVDPDRDTPDRLTSYLSNFHTDVRGVRIEDVGQLEALHKGFGIFVETHQESPDDESYLVDHTTRTYVLDREGRMTLTYGADIVAADLARDLRTLLRN